MQNDKETERINRFLWITAPVIERVVKKMFQIAGLQFEQDGLGLNIVFSIKKGDKEVKFYLYNLLMEIATIDRDEQSLRFDDRLMDFEFLKTKAARLIESKLDILICLLEEGDSNKAIENICQLAGKYQRIRIWQFDQKKQPEPKGD